MMLRTVYSDKAAEGVFCKGRSYFTIGWPTVGHLVSFFPEKDILLASHLRSPRKYGPTAVTDCRANRQ